MLHDCGPLVRVIAKTKELLRTSIPRARYLVIVVMP